MENRPHSREKQVGSGSASVEKGRRVGTQGPVGGGSQNGRPGMNPGGPQRTQGPRRGKTTGGIGLVGVLLILLFNFLRGGSSEAPSTPVATPRPTAYVTAQPTHTLAPQPEDGLESVDDASMMFSSDSPEDWAQLFGALFGYGESYSGAEPSGSSSSSNGGGLLQGLPGAKPTATPKPAATAKPKPTATAKPKATVKPKATATPAPVQASVRDKRVTPIGNGKDTVTVMVYMCGTDLESRYGMATSDLSEMAKAKLSDKVNLLVLTGGCRSWKNSVVSNRVNEVYRVRQGGLERLESNFGTASMTDPANLTKFIKYCASNYPANRNFLILWDHGGGSLSGYGYDEKQSSRTSMTLPQIDKALDDANIVFDWIGYDACLMSTLETALVSAKYADYLIASEEVEPGTGWYYTDWLNALSNNTSLSTESLGKTLIDTYVAACRQKSYSAQVTLAMTDLAALQAKIPAAFRDFSLSTNALITGDAYKQVSNARAGARQFAQSTRINQVDLADLALRIGTKEGNALAKTIQDCVTYNGTTITKCYGLSIYFPYETLSSVSSAVNTYDTLGLDAEYAKVIKSFASLEYGGQLGSSASQGSYGGYGFPSGGSSAGGSGGYGDLLQALFGAYSAAGSSASGSSAYGSGSPAGSLSGGYTNAYGQSSAGYSVDLNDLFGLFSAFSGRSLPAESSWVDTELIADQAEQLALDFLDPGRICVSMKNGQSVLSLTEEEWSLLQTAELNVFVDDGEGYLDLGFDNVLSFDADGDMILDYDNTWLTLNGEVVAYYLVSDTVNDDGSWTTVGRIPALLNGQLVNLQVFFTDEDPAGVITGAYPFYQNGETETASKGLIPLLPGDKLEFLCDYYGRDNSYAGSYTLGTALTVGSEGLTLENLTLENDNLIASCRLTDVYGNHYWLTF